MKDMSMKKTNCYKEYTTWFIVLMIFIFFAFILKNHSFIGNSDGYNIFFPVLAYSGEYYQSFITNVWNGDIVQFNFSIGYGEDVLGTLGVHGLGGLVSLIGIMIPSEYAAEWYTLICILKIYLAGLTFLQCMYTRAKSIEKNALLLATFVYIFSTYTFFYGLQFHTFLDILVFLPLAISGIEKILSTKSKVIIPTFLFAFWAQALSGFYFFYMLTIFCVIYFVVCGVTRIKNMKELFLKLGIAAINYLLAVGLAAVVFIPSVLAFLQSSRGGDSSISVSKIFSLYNINEIIKRIGNLFIKEGYQSGLGIPFFCGLILAALFLGKKYSGKYREYKIMLTIFGIGYFVPFFGSMMNGFSYSTDRWIFMLIFIIAALIGEVLSEEIEISKKVIWGYSIIGLLIAIIFWLRHTISISDFLAFAINIAMWLSVLVTVIMLSRKEHIIHLVRSRIFYIGCIGMIAVSGFLLNAPVRIGGGGWSACFLPMKTAWESVVESKADIDAIEHEEFYRIDIRDASLATSLVLDYNGTSCYYSMFNSTIYDFYRELKISPAIRGSSFCVDGLDDREILQNLLAVRYSLDVNGEVEEHSTHGELGIAYGKYCLEGDVEELSAIERELLLQDYIILEEHPENVSAELYDTNVLRDYAEWITRVDYNINDSDVQWTDGIVQTVENGKLELSYESNVNLQQYVLLKNLVLLEGDVVEIAINNKTLQLRSEDNRAYLGGDNDYLIHLPYAEECSIVFPPGRYQLDTIEVYSVALPEEVILGKEEDSVSGWSAEGNNLYGEIEIDEEAVLFLSVPYSEAWRFFVDGAEVTHYKANWGFTALVLSAGKHVIEGNYHTPGLKAGMIIGMISVVILVILIIYQRKSEKN